MKSTLILLSALATNAAAVAAPPPAIAGRWTQSSNGSELVIVPRVKLQPSGGMITGTDLGGSTGYGSPTRTTIVTEPVPLQVQRTSTLSIDGGGGFVWATSKRHVETPGGKCIKTTHTEKRGQVTRTGNQMRFRVDGGNERWEKSCGGSGQAAVKPGSESYTVTFEGNRMKLAGGPATLVFVRG
ncbi:hypothetical protein FHS96_000376 [Sphingomonas zeicaulis]|uniref:hypothetical protein n=1 Tax=Sphingomonas zeicaulis TaxID=1632740 RepID=UPI003D21FC20